MGDCFQVHVFGDPGMEMMPECVYFFAKFVSRGMVLGAFVVSFGDLWGTFSDF